MGAWSRLLYKINLKNPSTSYDSLTKRTVETSLALHWSQTESSKWSLDCKTRKICAAPLFTKVRHGSRVVRAQSIRLLLRSDLGCVLWFVRGRYRILRRWGICPESASSAPRPTASAAPAARHLPRYARHALPRSSMRRAALSAARLGRARFNSSSRPTQEYDVLVVGGGVMGASVAYHTALSDPSLRVCVVERDTSYAHASAMLSAGGIRQQFSLPVNIQLSLYGVDFLRRLGEELLVPGAPPPDVQFKEQGYLFLASAQGEATLRRNQATQAAQGVSWTRLLSPEAPQRSFQP